MILNNPHPQRSVQIMLNNPPFLSNLTGSTDKQRQFHLRSSVVVDWYIISFFFQRKKDGRIMLSDLPTDCLRHIFSRISDHRDILRAGQTSSLLNEVTNYLIYFNIFC